MDTSELYQTRQNEFGAQYEDFEGTDIAGLAIRTGEWLETLLMDGRAVNATMTALYEQLFGAEHNERAPENWRDLWGGISLNDQMEPRGAQFMVGLNAFAFWGLRPDVEFFELGGQDNIDAAVEAYVARARTLLDAIPPGWGEVSELRRTVLAAEARIRIDTGRDVTSEQLAALARISLKSIKNMLTPKAGASDLRLNAAGEIPGADALRWLEGREDFKSSIWRSGSAVSLMPSSVGAKDVGEVVFVPVAKDGSWFDPVACRNARGYTIGPKGAEEPVEDYRLALERLARMRTPYWRRRNSAGNWGIVAGVSWQRRIVQDLPVATEEGA
jgi:hypothetical protein